MLKEVTVKTKSKSYKVIIGKNAIKEIIDVISTNDNKNLNIIIVDSTVLNKFRNYINNTLKKTNSKIIAFNTSEKQKSINGFKKLSNKIFKLYPNRKTKIIIIGGGVIGDLGGFIASSILRGLELIIVPTTLLAQVDSSIGGKNGINNKFGKNLIGSFYQPSLVVIDTNFLKTLPLRQIKSGYVEIYKHSLIKNKKFCFWLEKNYKNIMNLKQKYIVKAIFESIKIKSHIVQKDENENLLSRNSRALLNFGHTVGHALEAINGYKNNLTHGEAVSIGMVYASKISSNLKFISERKAKNIRDHLLKIGLPVKAKSIKVEKLLKFIIRDKKNDKNQIKLVLLKDVGHAFISKNYNMQQMRKILRNYINDS